MAGCDLEQSVLTLNLFCFEQVFRLQTSSGPSKLRLSVIETRRCCLCVTMTSCTGSHGFKRASPVSAFLGSHWLVGAILSSHTPALVIHKMCGLLLSGYVGEYVLGNWLLHKVSAPSVLSTPPDVGGIASWQSAFKPHITTKVKS